MNYYTLSNPTNGNPTKVDIFNQIAINLERLNQQFNNYGALYYSTTAFTIPTAAVGFIVDWDQTQLTADYNTPLYIDDLQLMDQKTFTTYTVPYGYSYARLHCQFAYAVATSSAGVNLYFLKNGSKTFTGNFERGTNETAGTSIHLFHSPWISVKAGDRFQVAADNAYTIDFASTAGFPRWFQLELRK